MGTNNQIGNVLLIGNSGVGKSTLINAVLGKDAAVTGWGTEGTTKELKIYGDENDPFRVIDTIGFEPSYFKEERAVRAVRKWAKESAKKGNENTQINVIWFCISGTSRKLFDKTIKALVRATSFYKTVPVVAVITKSYSLPEREENIELVKKAFSEQKRQINLKGIVPVVALAYKINDEITVQPNGITELIDATNSLMPEGFREAANDLAEYKLNRKRAFAQSVVGVSVAGGATVGAIPIPFPDALLLTPIETAEVNSLASIYGINKSDKGKRFLNSIIEVGTVSAGAKQIINLIKAIPGLNVAGAVLNAVIAGVICGALGEAAIYAFEQVYLGNKTLDDIDWLKKITESKMLDKVNKILELLPEIINKNMTIEEIINAISSLFIKPEKKRKKAK